MSSNKPVASCTATPGLDYEVFLSFRGVDNRINFTDHLYHRLIDAGIRVFRDDEEIKQGEKIEEKLHKAINQSKIAIPILSKRYAESKWCLKELVQVVECKKTVGLKVMPIFYDVAPSEVRNQTGDYGGAFELHEKCYDRDTIKSWRKALREVGELRGWEMQNSTHHRQEGELVKEVTNIVLRELKKAHLVVIDHLVGLECHVQEVLNMLTTDINGVKIIIIHGMGGIGKTTLGKVIYNNLLPCFERHCFLANIRETARSKGMIYLQNYLISNTLHVESIDFSSIDEGSEIIHERLYSEKVLLILDDVDEISQLKAFIRNRDRFVSGSRIVITTRNKGIFDHLKVDWFYELGCLASLQALRLFSLHAFRSDKPPKKYAALSQKIVEIAGGLPLALEVFGSLLCGKSIEKWDSIIKKLEKVPHEEVGAKLRISYKALDDQTRQMFLDIACFFIGVDKRIAVHFWDDSYIPEEAMEVLQQRSLIKIEEDYSIWMHDQLRDLGREIVQQEDKEYERRSRLWNEEEGTKLLRRKMGSPRIRGINLDFQRKAKYSISNKDFARLPNLRFLRVRGFDERSYKKIIGRDFSRGSPPIFSKLRWLSWHDFPRTFDTSNVSLEDLVVLDLSYSEIRSHWSCWSCIEMATNLKVLKLIGCKKLVKTPRFSSHLKLEQLILDRCVELKEIDDSISQLKHLIILSLYKCTRLRKLPKKLRCTESLEKLNIDKTAIVEIPDWPLMRRLRFISCCKCSSLNMVSTLDCAANLTKLYLDETKITALPDSIGNLVNLQSLSLQYCKNISKLPKSIGNLVNLRKLYLSHCEIVELRDTMGKLKNLEILYVDHNPITELPASIGMMENLTTLDATSCYKLRDVPKLPQSLVSLKLTCREMQIKDLSRLTNLAKLKLRACDKMQNIPEFPPSLKDLHIDDCRSLGLLSDLPTGLTQLTVEYCSSLALLDLSNLREIDLLKVVNTPISKVQGIWSCKSLQKLHISGWELSKMDGLERLENLTSLVISRCENLDRLPDLSNLKKLRTLKVSYCPRLVKIPGQLESLKEFSIENCESLKRIPEIPNSKTMGDSFSVRDCKKLDKSPQ